jgi:hypothetical protein
MNENPELIRINEKVVKRNPEAVKKPLKIEPGVSGEFQKGKYKIEVTPEEQMIASPYIKDEEELDEAASMYAKLLKEKDRHFAKGGTFVSDNFKRDNLFKKDSEHN